MAGYQLYEENLDRIQRTMRFEKTDRAPVLPVANAWCTRPIGVTLADYCVDGPYSVDVHLRCWTSIDPVVDAVQCCLYNVYFLMPMWLSRVRIPGIDLPADDLWQVEEAELVTVGDYHEIVSGGFGPWYGKFLKERLGDPLSKLGPSLGAVAPSFERYKEAGIVPLVAANITIPFEMFCGGRSMAALMMDMYKRPDLLEEVLGAAFEEVHESNRRLLQAVKPLGVWVGGWRGASSLMSPAMWRRYVWPHYKATVEMVVEEGAIPVLHLDSDWTSSLAHFRELPKHKCIMALDGATDIRKAREAMSGHMAILGDVHPASLAFGTPEEVSGYVKGLIKEFGGRGYMVGSGCDIPFNAKLDNVRAMLQAAYDA